MDSLLQKVLSSFSDRLINYLPNLVAGLVLIGIGWGGAWLVKRIVVQVMVILRFDRLLRRFRWGASFQKADVRHAFYEFVGNGAFVVVFLILLNAALQALQLTVLSNMIERGVEFIPKLLIAAVIFGCGWLLAGWMSGSIRRALAREEIPRATLIARFTKIVAVLFFSAMALAELDIAREIVVIGFGATIVTLGMLAVVLTAVGGKNFVSRILEALEE
jgi:pimeloyl-ACP methyl ester carboxylesterase